MDSGHCLLERRCPCSLLAHNIMYFVVGLNSSSSAWAGARRRYDKRNLTVWSALAFDILVITRLPRFSLQILLTTSTLTTKLELLVWAWGPGSSVSIATDYGLDGPGSNPGGCQIFRPSRPALGPTQTPVKWVPGLSRGVKCGRGVLLNTHLLLVSRSWKSRAIPLPNLWATPGM